ncbi:hypothetical protein [Salicibibacter cibarius]|nr:hypothetical protein [Salicibibacter cibarius]
MIKIDEQLNTRVLSLISQKRLDISQILQYISQNKQFISHLNAW